jgi:hypothetical protein
MQCRAKFRVIAIEYYEYPGGSARVKLSPVTASKNAAGEWIPNEENKAFWQATPCGSIELTINNPEGVKVFELGKEYYVDFTPAPVPA